jgi:CubicO group peptidase (beta-lactamase class C family)
MHAVQEGILDLNVPVKEYLPEFNIYSRFDEDPLSKITIKHLLSHKAGFTHEAPIGNNFDASFSSFKEHVLSISDTWLKFPVGERYSYSNLGIDLAGWILEKQSGIPFHEYVRINLLEPLGMNNSSFDTDWILNNNNRARGHSSIFLHIPEAIPIIPSGGLYSSIKDMARYVQFHLNQGIGGDSQILRTDMLDTMYSIPYAYPGQQFGYALGIDRRGKNKTLMLNHGGGGFGFLSLMIWYPAYDFGVVTLSNTDDHNLQNDLAFEISDQILDYLKKARGVSNEPELSGLPPQTSIQTIPSGSGPNKPEWKKYTGMYRIRSFNQPVWKGIIKIKNGYLYYNDQPLEEFLPGLFFDPDGEAIDMRGEVPTYRNIILEKIEIPVWVRISNLIVMTISLSFILGWPVIYILNRNRFLNPAKDENNWPLMNTLIGYLISLLILAYLYLLFYEIPFALYETYPWYYRYPIYVKIVLVLPFITLLIGVYLLITSIKTWKFRIGHKIQRIFYVTLTGGTMLFILLLGHWKQFGTFY